MCDYSTPCGWCTKWDKKCDKKIGNESEPEIKDCTTCRNQNPVGCLYSDECVVRELQGVRQSTPTHWQHR